MDTTALMAKNRNKKKKKQSSSKGEKSVTCYVCGVEGHYAKNYPKRKSKPEQLFFSSFVEKTKCASDRCIDSGAAAHMRMSERILRIRISYLHSFRISQSATLLFVRLYRTTNRETTFVSSDYFSQKHLLI